MNAEWDKREAQTTLQHTDRLLSPTTHGPAYLVPTMIQNPKKQEDKLQLALFANLFEYLTIAECYQSPEYRRATLL